jgi:hypothetical protein
MNPRHREALQRAREAAASQQRRDPKAWAREVVAAHERGEVIRPVRVREAHLALGLPVPRGMGA